MHWPDIFFRAKPGRRIEKITPPEAPIEPSPETPAPEPAAVEEPASLSLSQRLPVSKVTLPPAPVHPASSDQAVIRDMEEADTLRSLSRSGGVRLIKRDFSPRREQARADLASKIQAAAAATAPAIDPTPPPVETVDVAPEPVSVSRPAPAINLATPLDSGASPAAPLPASMTIFRRRTKIADVARVVLPPRREEVPTQSAPSPVPAVRIGAPLLSSPPPNAVPASNEAAAIVIPPSFPVALPTRATARVHIAPVPSQDEETVIEPDKAGAAEPPVGTPVEDSGSARPMPVDVMPPEPPVGEATTPGPLPAESVDESKSETENKQSTSVPNVREEALPLATEPADTRQKREFVLSNGERILGHVLSENAESVYVDHATLGVLTIPRSQMAQRPVEIILINGDRIVGDILAETAESIFVKHASLGILTVPRNQRSTRVVEAILKDGDRILGEVLGETANFTVIRSATLGTVAVPHNKVAMLNRRAEQVEMKALPMPAGTLPDQATS